MAHENTRIIGMVMNAEGEPVAGALVSPEGVAQGGSIHWGGTDRFVEDLCLRNCNFCRNNSQHLRYAGRDAAFKE
jgi:hypothetical protein